MSHTDQIAITRQNSGRIVKRLAFCQRGGFDFAGFADFATEQVEGAAKGDARSGAGFEEHVGQYGAFQHPGDAATLGVRLHTVCHGENAIDAVAVKLSNREYVSAF